MAPTQPEENETTSLQEAALNGAQVTAAVDIVVKVSTGELPTETAINMLVDFFQLNPESAKRMVLPASRKAT